MIGEKIRAARLLVDAVRAQERQPRLAVAHPHDEILRVKPEGAQHVDGQRQHLRIRGDARLRR